MDNNEIKKVLKEKIAETIQEKERLQALVEKKSFEIGVMHCILAKLNEGKLS